MRGKGFKLQAITENIVLTNTTVENVNNTINDNSWGKKGSASRFDTGPRISPFTDIYFQYPPY